MAEGSGPEAWRVRVHLPAYTAVEAARYAQTRARVISSWYRGQSKQGPALGAKERHAALSYVQLIEVAFVASARRHGISMQSIRRAREYLSDWFQHPYPFALTRIQTDGYHLLVEDPGHLENGHLVVADCKGQIAWKDALAERLVQLEFERELVVRWWLRGRDVPITIDPRIAFGAPCISGIPTWAIKDRHSAGETVLEIRQDFSLTEEEVRLALAFEHDKPAT
jgi:uncharacterized protein (DUF433 family)